MTSRIEIHHQGPALVMGILNTTPDSFSDGGQFNATPRAVAHAREMVAAGASIIDVGGESTRPGAKPVSAEEEINRVVPVIEAIRSELVVPISIDTSKPEVMRAAVAAGAGMINDVFGLRQPGAIETAAELGVQVCLMHMQGEPRDMQHNPHYENVVREVTDFLLQRAQSCEQAGIAREDIVLDPGFGFGKTLEHNRTLFHSLSQFAALPYACLVGVSRKSMLGQLTGRESDQRVPASITAAVLADQAGAAIVRVHDVAETVDALKTARALQA